ncbi:MAG: hypothetical protein HYY18_11525 [Planctomycetes bacterium]|nr:hypothetical protein [Planctomycetota bacterium]
MPPPAPTFLKKALASIGAEVKDVPPGILEVSLPEGAAPHFDDQAQLALTFDREVHRASERDLDLVMPGAPIFRSLLAALEGAGAASAVEFPDAPDPAKAQAAARGGLSLRQGTVTASTSRVEPFSGMALLFRLRLEGAEREDSLMAVFVPAAGDAFLIPAESLERMARAGKPGRLAAMMPGDRVTLREAAVVAAQREGDRRARAAEAKAAGKMAREVQQVRAYFEALGRELKEQKDESRGEDAKKEAGARLRNLDRERDLRLIEVQDRYRAHAAVEPVAVLGVTGQAARVAVVFQAGARRLEREVLWFPPLESVAPPACDMCEGPLLEASLCGDPSHDVLLCAECRRYCQTCGAGLCRDHTKTCHCGAVACPAHGAPCEACAQFCCRNHQLKCVACCRPFCQQHAHPCGVCNLISCADHSKRCGSCTLELCPEHGTPCDVTGKVACPKHVKTCGECGEKVLDVAYGEGLCQACRSLKPVMPGDPAAAAAVTWLPEAAKASWFRSDTKSRVMMVGKTWFRKYRVWLTKDLKPLNALGGTKLFSMKKLK